MSDLFFAPSKPAWIKRFRKPAVCNKNPRSFCLHFPVPFPRLKTPLLHIYSSQRGLCVLYVCGNVGWWGMKNAACPYRTGGIGMSCGGIGVSCAEIGMFYGGIDLCCGSIYLPLHSGQMPLAM